MDGNWLSTLSNFFRPEPSFRFSCEKCKPVPENRSVCSGPTVSIKALFWTAVSVLAGLAIGQLC